MISSFAVSKRDVLELNALFGILAHRTLELLDDSIVRYYTCAERTPLIAISAGGENTPHFFYAGVNQCSCDSFKFNVKVLKIQYTCKHNLASRLAIALKREQVVEISLTQYKNLLRHIENIAQ